MNKIGILAAVMLLFGFTYTYCAPICGDFSGFQDVINNLLITGGIVSVISLSLIVYAVISNNDHNEYMDFIFIRPYEYDLDSLDGKTF
jgi:hypothetical protein